MRLTMCALVTVVLTCALPLLGRLYDMHWPYRRYATARGALRGPFHDRLVAAGACMGETAGWERPNWFARPGETPEYVYSYGRQNWFEACGEECRRTQIGRASCRERVCQ